MTGSRTFSRRKKTTLSHDCMVMNIIPLTIKLNTETPNKYRNAFQFMTRLKFIMAYLVVCRQAPFVLLNILTRTLI